MLGSREKREKLDVTRKTYLETKKTTFLHTSRLNIEQHPNGFDLCANVFSLVVLGRVTRTNVRASISRKRNNPTLHPKRGEKCLGQLRPHIVLF